MISATLGSPPRVRSRLPSRVGGFSYLGITSACAEQTTTYGMTNSSVGDHLRVCGADGGYKDPVSVKKGSPPRVRSRLRMALRVMVTPGITSACAEQTR